MKLSFNISDFCLIGLFEIVFVFENYSYYELYIVVGDSLINLSVLDALLNKILGGCPFKMLISFS